MILKVIENGSKKFVEIGDNVTCNNIDLNEIDKRQKDGIEDLLNNEKPDNKEIKIYFDLESEIIPNENYYLKNNSRIKIVESNKKVLIFKNDGSSKIFLLNNNGQTIEKI
jgi:hypothetical protein